MICQYVQLGCDHNVGCKETSTFSFQSNLLGEIESLQRYYNQTLTFVIESFVAESFIILNYPFGGVRSAISVSSFHVHFSGNNISLPRLVNNTDRVNSNGLGKFITNEVLPCSAIIPSIRKPIRAALVVERTSGFVSKVT